MFPTLIGEGEWALPSYFALMMIGFLVAALLQQRDGMRQGFDGAKIIDLAILMLVTGTLGARVFHVLFDGFLGDYIALCTDPDSLASMLPDGSPCVTDAQCAEAGARGADIGGVCRLETGQCVPEQDCLRAFKFWTGGLTWYGGLIFGLGTAWIWSRVHNWSFLRYLDTAAPAIAIGHFFGRIGCFLSGCCYGQVCEAPWGVQFPAGSSAYSEHAETHRTQLIEQHQHSGIWESLPVHPAQLYEAGLLFGIFALLWFGLRKRKRFDGEVMGWFLVLYGLARFMVEFWRADPRGAALGISTSQWISLILVPVGMALLVWGFRRMGRVGPGGGGDDAAPPAADAPVAGAGE